MESHSSLRRKISVATPRLPLPFLPLLLSTIPLLTSAASIANDRDRLGTHLTGIPLYRTPGNANVVKLGLGTPEQSGISLSVSTGINYVVVVDNEHAELVSQADTFDPASSSSYKSDSLALQSTFTNPYAGSLANPTSQLSGTFFEDVIRDARQDPWTRKMVLVADASDGFPAGSAGYWGLGVDASNPSSSLIPQIATTQTSRSFVVGFDMANYSTDTFRSAGTMHWGAAPEGAYSGSFNWLEPTGGWNTWAIDVDHFAVGTGDHRVSMKGMTAAVDPAYNVIAAPYAVVREIYAQVPGAAQDPVYPARWNLACDASLHLSLVIDGLVYRIADQGLVQHRNSKTCWGGLVAWGNGTQPDEEGQIVLGVPFMQGVYSVLYYSADQNYVGLAAKAGSVNERIERVSNALSSGKKAAIIVPLVLLLVFGLLFLYARARNSPQGIAKRMFRHNEAMARTQMAMVNPGFVPPPAPIPPMAEVGLPRQHWSRPWMKGANAYEMPPEQVMVAQHPSATMTDGTLIEPFVGGYNSDSRRDSRESGGWFGWLKGRKREPLWDGRPECEEDGTTRHHEHLSSPRTSGMAYDGSYDDARRYEPYPMPAPVGGPSVPQMYPGAMGEGYPGASLGWPPALQPQPYTEADTEASRYAQSYRHARRHSSDQTQDTSGHRSHHRRHSTTHHTSRKHHDRRERGRQRYHSPPPRYVPTIATDATTGARTDRGRDYTEEEDGNRKGLWNRIFG